MIFHVAYLRNVADRHRKYPIFTKSKHGRIPSMRSGYKKKKKKRKSD